MATVTERRFVSQLAHNEHVSQVFLASDKQLRPNRNGNLYLQLQLSGRSGAIATRLWNASENDYRGFENGDYVLVVGRIESVKRVELAIAAMAAVPPPLRLIIAGEGSQRAAAERAVAEQGLQERVTFAGAIAGDALIDLYAGSLAVVYAPFDEDYGYVTLEAFLCAKPVITATDSGGTLEFVVDDQNGFVCAPEPPAIGAALARLAADRAYAARLGQAGRARAEQITWDGVVERLLG